MSRFFDETHAALATNCSTYTKRIKERIYPRLQEVIIRALDTPDAREFNALCEKYPQYPYRASRIQFLYKNTSFDFTISPTCLAVTYLQKGDKYLAPFEAELNEVLAAYDLAIQDQGAILTYSRNLEQHIRTPKQLAVAWPAVKNYIPSKYKFEAKRRLSFDLSVIPPEPDNVKAAMMRMRMFSQ